MTHVLGRHTDEALRSQFQRRFDAAVDPMPGVDNVHPDKVTWWQSHGYPHAYPWMPITAAMRRVEAAAKAAERRIVRRTPAGPVPRVRTGYHVGFTGTRAGMTPEQKAQLRTRLAEIKAEHPNATFHHGQAVGADEEAAQIASDLGYHVVAHPSVLQAQTSSRTDLNAESRAPKAPLVRNRDIVSESDVVLATPRTPREELRSGTWATIRHAGKTGVPVERIYPSTSANGAGNTLPAPADRLSSLLTQEKAGRTIDVLPFFGAKAQPEGSVGSGVLSQHWPASFEIDGVGYTSTEQYMMAAKARMFGDDDALARILATDSPVEAKRIGRQVRNFDPQRWDSASYGVVVRANLAKFGQNPDLKRYLLSTGDRVLVEASPRDRNWGVGMGPANPDTALPSRWRGGNKLGFALMDVRDRLRTAETPKVSAVADEDMPVAYQEAMAAVAMRKMTRRKAADLFDGQARMHRESAGYVHSWAPGETERLRRENLAIAERYEQAAQRLRAEAPSPTASSAPQQSADRPLVGRELAEGEALIWTPGDGAPVRGTVVKVRTAKTTRTYIDWEGGRREPVGATQALGPDVRRAPGPAKAEVHSLPAGARPIPEAVAGVPNAYEVPVPGTHHDPAGVMPQLDIYVGGSRIGSLSGPTGTPPAWQADYADGGQGTGGMFVGKDRALRDLAVHARLIPPRVRDPGPRELRGKWLSTALEPGDRILVEFDSEHQLLPEMSHGDGFPVTVRRANEDGSVDVVADDGRELRTKGRAGNIDGEGWLRFRKETPAAARRRKQAARLGVAGVQSMTGKEVLAASLAADRRSAPAIDSLDRKTKPELQAMLRARGLPVSGTKPQLIARLRSGSSAGAPMSATAAKTLANLAARDDGTVVNTRESMRGINRAELFKLAAAGLVELDADGSVVHRATITDAGRRAAAQPTPGQRNAFALYTRSGVEFSVSREGLARLERSLVDALRGHRRVRIPEFERHDVYNIRPPGGVTVDRHGKWHSAKNGKYINMPDAVRDVIRAVESWVNNGGDLSENLKRFSDKDVRATAKFIGIPTGPMAHRDSVIAALRRRAVSDADRQRAENERREGVGGLRAASPPVGTRREVPGGFVVREPPERNIWRPWYRGEQKPAQRSDSGWSVHRPDGTVVGHVGDPQKAEALLAAPDVPIGTRYNLGYETYALRTADGKWVVYKPDGSVIGSAPTVEQARALADKANKARLSEVGPDGKRVVDASFGKTSVGRPAPKMTVKATGRKLTPEEQLAEDFAMGRRTKAEVMAALNRAIERGKVLDLYRKGQISREDAGKILDAGGLGDASTLDLLSEKGIRPEGPLRANRVVLAEYRPLADDIPVRLAYLDDEGRVHVNTRAGSRLDLLLTMPNGKSPALGTREGSEVVVDGADRDKVEGLLAAYQSVNNVREYDDIEIGDDGKKRRIAFVDEAEDAFSRGDAFLHSLIVARDAVAMATNGDEGKLRDYLRRQNTNVLVNTAATFFGVSFPKRAAKPSHDAMVEMLASLAMGAEGPGSLATAVAKKSTRPVHAPSVAMLKRRTKPQLVVDLQRAGVANIGGSKQEMAERLHEALLRAGVPEAPARAKAVKKAAPRKATPRTAGTRAWTRTESGPSDDAEQWLDDTLAIVNAWRNAHGLLPIALADDTRAI